MNYLDGRFKIGCNYWASHAGAAMWGDWRPEVVRQDFRMMAEAGLELARVFPLWPEFQPLTMHSTYQQRPKELRNGEQPLADKSGVSAAALSKFRELADIAAENHVSLVVGLLTGWMSGRLFVPDALAGRDIFNDALSLKWQLRFVRRFVREFKGHEAIALWELGNECNCMGEVTSREEAWRWTNAVTSAIRLEDNSTPVASGMHGLYPQADASFDAWGSRGCWSIEDQGELTDVLTAHPYPHSPSKRAARVDPVGSLRSVFQATVEARLYGDIAQRPSLIEEIGTFGPMVCDEAIQADFIRNVALNGLAHDCGGLLWWCAFDQLALENTPYEWNAWERELGLFRADLSKKPVCEELGKLRRRLDALPRKALPKFRRDAVCLLTPGGSNDSLLGDAWSCFVLAKQAGFDIEFQYEGEPLKDAPLYLVPSIKGSEALGRRTTLELERRVEAGASLLVSVDTGFLSPFNQIFGLRCANREERVVPASFKFDGSEFHCKAQYKLRLVAEGAEVLAAEPDGTPILTRFKKSEGEAWFMALPLESHLAGLPRGFDADAEPYHTLYAAVAKRVLAKRLLRRDNPRISVTEHPLDDAHALALLVNNDGKPQNCRLELASGWKTARTSLELPAHDGALIELTKDTKAS